MHINIVYYGALCEKSPPCTLKIVQSPDVVEEHPDENIDQKLLVRDYRVSAQSLPHCAGPRRETITFHLGGHPPPSSPKKPWLWKQ